jgi:hypothetical protein
MNCNNDFNIPYKQTYVKVKPFCESSDVHYKVYLFEKELKIQLHKDEMGRHRWHEFNKGETDLANELGRLIEEQQKL